MKYKILSALVLFGIGALFHFVYDVIENPFFAWLFPVNESIFEQLKLFVVPISLYYFLLMLKGNGNKENLFLRLNVSIVVGCLFMVSFYYTIFGIIGKNIDVINILNLLFTFIVSFYLSEHIVGSKKIDIPSSLVIYFSLLFLMIVLTYNPIKIPFFYDFIENKYGI